MSKPNVTPVQSATEWTASVHTLHISKPNVTRIQSATEWTAWVHALHMSKPDITRVQSAAGWTASVHTLHMSKRLRNGYILYTCLKKNFSYLYNQPNWPVRGCLKKSRVRMMFLLCQHSILVTLSHEVSVPLRRLRSFSSSHRSVHRARYHLSVPSSCMICPHSNAVYTKT